jgi:integrase
VLSDAELEAFLKAFDCADPVGLRDYAMARRLIDLGLRGHEVTYLTLGSVDWRRATLTISSTKSRRAQEISYRPQSGRIGEGPQRGPVVLSSRFHLFFTTRLIRRVLRDGWSWEAALAEARKVGLTQAPHLEKFAKQYIAARRTAPK